MAGRMLISVATVCLDVIVIAICSAGALAVAMKADLPATVDASGAGLVLRAVDDVSGPLHDGDTLIAIDGRSVRTIWECEFLLDNKHVGDTVTVSLGREGASAAIIVSLPLVRYYDAWYTAMNIGIASAYLLLGLLVALRRPFDAVARLFHILIIAAVCTMSLTWGSLLEPSPDVVRLLRWMLAVALSYVGMLLLHFTTVFPERNPRITNATIRSGYVLMGLLALAHIVTLEGALATSSAQAIDRLSIVYRVSFLALAAFAVLAVWQLVHTFRHTREEAARRIIRLELVGVAVAIAGFLLLWWFPRNLLGRPVVSESLGIIPLVAAPLAFAAAILRYRALQVDVFVRRGTVSIAVFGFLLATIAVVMMLAVFMIGPMFSMRLAFEGDQARAMLLALLLTAVVVAVMVEPVRSRARRVIDRSVYHVRYNHAEEIRILRDRMRECYDERSIVHLITGRLRILLDLDRITVLLRRDHDASYEFVEQHGFVPPLPAHRLRLTDIRLDVTKRLHARPELVEAGIPLLPIGHPAILRSGVALLRPFLSEDGSLLGVIACGAKHSGMRFAAEDVELVHAIAAAAARGIERIRLHRTLVLQHAETERLAELNRMKSFFVSAVTHDLKTPLTSMHMFSELLEARTDDETARSWLHIIRGETDRLAMLVDNVLGFAQIEQDRRVYTMTPLDLNIVVGNALAVMQYQFDMHRVEVETRLLAEPLRIQGDATALQQLVINLLVNAIRYSPKHKHITLITSDDGDRCRLQVIDRGMGIAPDQLPHIFEPFSRIVAPRTGEATAANSRAGGTGLGLTIVRHTVHAHHGTIDVHSEVGSGTTFTLTFPRGDTHGTHPDHRG